MLLLGSQGLEGVWPVLDTVITQTLKVFSNGLSVLLVFVFDHRALSLDSLQFVKSNDDSVFAILFLLSWVLLCLHLGESLHVLDASSLHGSGSAESFGTSN